MHFTKRIAPVLAVLATAALLASPATAQSHQGALTLTGGGSIFSDLAPGIAGTSAQFEPGWTTGLQMERWLGGGRTGLRFNTLWTQRQLVRTGYYNYNLFMAETDLLIRFRRPRAGNAFQPFFGLGAGATYYAGVAGTGPIADGAYGNPVIRAQVTASLGMDLFSSQRTGLRFEVGDQIVLPSVGRSPDASGVPMVHNLVASLGFQLRTGSLWNRATRMAEAAPEPAPTASPAVEPEPEPAVESGAEPVPAADELAMELEEKDEQIASLEARVASLERLMSLDATKEATADPEPVAEPAPEPMPVSTPDATARFTVQVGSFIEEATADRWVERLQERGFPVWRSDTEVQGQKVSRVRVGALASESEAQALADVLKRDYGWPVWVDQIRNEESVPADAVTRTRETLFRD